MLEIIRVLSSPRGPRPTRSGRCFASLAIAFMLVAALPAQARDVQRSSGGGSDGTISGTSSTAAPAGSRAPSAKRPSWQGFRKSRSAQSQTATATESAASTGSEAPASVAPDAAPEASTPEAPAAAYSPPPAAPASAPSMYTAPSAPAVDPPTASPPGSSSAAPPADPTPEPSRSPDVAVGFGSAESGGTDKPVVEVTNLRDNPPELPPAPGSLRAALSGGDRTIRFRVSGNIELEHRLVVKHPNVTIDGSDAPNGGIALYGAQLTIDTDNVIVRNLRFRGSNRTISVDGLEIGGGSDILIDHVSCSWTSDECISFYGYNYTGRGSVRRVTIQNSMISEMPSPNPYGLLVDGDVSDVTFYRNVWAKNPNRNPQIATGQRGGPGGTGALLAGVGRYELLHNIIYDAVYGTRIWNQSPHWTIQLDAIGNYWKPGLRYPWPKIPIMVFNDPASLGPIKVFLADNLGPGHETKSSGQACDYFSRETSNSACAGYAPAHAAASRMNAGYAIPGRSASEDFAEILANAGAILPCRDSHDTRIA
jgi:hypothetical protein